MRDDELAVILEAAARAPSFFNMQPWQVHATPHALVVRIDRARASSLLDRGARVSAFTLGGFVENAVRTARSIGKTLTVSVLEASDPFELSVRLDEGPACDAEPALLEHVLARETNRQVFSAEPLSDAQLAAFRAPPDASLAFHLVTGDAKDALAEVLGLASAVVNFQRPLWEEQRTFLRLTDEDASSTRDGVDLATITTDDDGRRFVRFLDTFEGVLDVLDPEVMAAQAALTIRNSSHAVVLTTRSARTAVHLVDAGRLFEAAWIDSGAAGVAMHPTGVLGLFSILDDDELRLVLDADGVDDIRELIGAANEVLGLAPDERLIFAARLSHGSRAPVRSLRRPWRSFTRIDP